MNGPGFFIRHRLQSTSDAILISLSPRKHPAIREDWPGAVKEPLERWEAYLYGDQNVFGATSDSALNVAAGTFGMESTVGITNVLPKMSVALLE